MKLSPDARQRNADSLREYFTTDGECGALRSIHGPLVDMAASGGGGGGYRDPESLVTGRRFGKNGLVGRHADVRRALKAMVAAGPIGGLHVGVLRQAYGVCRRWTTTQVMTSLKPLVHKTCGDERNVAVLTNRVQCGILNDEIAEERVQDLTDEGRKPKRKRQRSTGVIVWQPPSAVYNDGTMEVIISEAKMLLEQAHAAYALASGEFDPEHVEPKKRRPKRPTSTAWHAPMPDLGGL
jgi:hypothetical protein